MSSIYIVYDIYSKCCEPCLFCDINFLIENIIQVFCVLCPLLPFGYNSTRAVWLFSCNDRALLARCAKHIQSVFNLIVDILMDIHVTVN